MVIVDSTEMIGRGESLDRDIEAVNAAIVAVEMIEDD